jgi:hypothetical protein
MVVRTVEEVDRQIRKALDAGNTKLYRVLLDEKIYLSGRYIYDVSAMLCECGEEVCSGLSCIDSGLRLFLAGCGNLTWDEL